MVPILASNDFPWGLVIVTAIVVILLIAGVTFFKRFKKCGNDELIVVYGLIPGGRTFKIVTPGKRVFVRPVLQEALTISLKPMEIEFDRSSNLGEGDSQYQFEGKVTFGVGLEMPFRRNAAERLLGLERSEIKQLAVEALLEACDTAIGTDSNDNQPEIESTLHARCEAHFSESLKNLGLQILDYNLSFHAVNSDQSA